jgi:hypothetical protein
MKQNATGITLLRARSDAIDCIRKRMVKNPGHEAQDDPAVELDDEDIARVGRAIAEQLGRPPMPSRSFAVRVLWG